MLLRFHQNELGATIVEYAIMLALIAAICFAAITMVGIETSSFWNSSSERISEMVNSNRSP